MCFVLDKSRAAPPRGGVERKHVRFVEVSRAANFAKSLGALPVTLSVGALACSSEEPEPASSEADN